MISPEVGRRLLYRSQSILGPRFVEGLEDWTRIRLGRGWCLSAHPDLEVTHATDGKREIALLGYLLDPFEPAATNADLVTGLLSELAAGTDLLVHTGRFGGRWILIVDDGAEVRLFHDALGLRQVYYTDVKRIGELWCAAEPKIVAEVLHLQKDEDALALVASGQWPTREHRLPGESSAYVGIKRLLPNHYLDLSSGRSHRYWPVKRFEPLDFEDCVERSSRILEGLMESASRRFPLAISLTAGRDSRLVLASARRIAHKASYVTVAKPQSPSYDVEVPARLLRRLGLKHDIIPWPSTVNKDFARVFRQNVSLPHEVWVPEAYAVFEYNRLTKVAVTGSAGEMGRLRYRASRFGEDDDEAVTPEKLSVRAKMGESRYAIEAYRTWLAGVPRLRRPSVLELYRWEGGNWLATAQLEFNTAWRDILTPYNCRRLLAGMISVDRKLRCGPRFRLFEALMRRLWPEVLTEPFPRMKQHFIFSPARIKRVVGLLWRKVS